MKITPWPYHFGTHLTTATERYDCLPFILAFWCQHKHDWHPK